MAELQFGLMMGAVSILVLLVVRVAAIWIDGG